MQVKEPTFSVSNMFTFNSQQYFKYFDFIGEGGFSKKKKINIPTDLCHHFLELANCLSMIGSNTDWRLLDNIILKVSHKELHSHTLKWNNIVFIYYMYK